MLQGGVVSRREIKEEEEEEEEDKLREQQERKEEEEEEADSVHSKMRLILDGSRKEMAAATAAAVGETVDCYSHPTFPSLYVNATLYFNKNPQQSSGSSPTTATATRHARSTRKYTQTDKQTDRHSGLLCSALLCLGKCQCRHNRHRHVGERRVTLAVLF